ncbi:hypothetical protein EDD18DRAFT_786224 [Armillaria luteobubalina]|uniref:BTB domain-containing protein n=1 Tax=Armillaria luteobubalina TaxID=153913 RepID=A0AA39QG20_9AGAR|nr:hypothetical protein EDD18DRAFT_786224 [Armillaria luteobubalina]
MTESEECDFRMLCQMYHPSTLHKRISLFLCCPRNGISKVRLSACIDFEVRRRKALRIDLWAPIGVGTRKVNQSQWYKHHSMRHEKTGCHLLIGYHHQQMYIDAQPSESPVTTANAPFNDPTDNVDLVIRTVDNVEFFVLGLLLTLRSPSSFFRHALQDSNHTERDGFPVLEVTEDSDTFRTILLFCYPDVAPELKSVEQLRAVGAALDKYCMDRAMRRFVQAALTSPMIREQPLQVFALAIANKWKEVGEAAARNTLAMPLNQVISDVEESNIIAARHLYHLVTYHTRCGKAAQIKEPYSWLRKDSGLTFLQYTEPYTGTPTCRWCDKSIGYIAGAGFILYGHPWLERTYLPLVNSKLLLEPRPQVALDNVIIGLAIYASIQECSKGSWALASSSQIRHLGEMVAEEIERRILEVPLGIEWKK